MMSRLLKAGTVNFLMCVRMKSPCKSQIYSREQAIAVSKWYRVCKHAVLRVGGGAVQEAYT